MTVKKEMKQRTAALHNLGCKVNAYETESMQQMLEQAGYKNVDFADIADVYISTSDLLLEYHLPKASSWCDLVLLGVGDKGYEVIIVELKNYRKETETKPGDFEGLIWHNGTVRQHPAAQVRQYTQYCQYFHSTVVEEKANDPEPKKEEVQTGNIVKSPMVGTFYIKPSPTSNPYVEVGSEVKKGTVLCIIEAMKLMNEIESEFDGKIVEILVKDGEPVEYGQPLFRIV